MTGISSQLLLAKNLNIFNTFGEYPAKFENVKDFQSSLGVFGDTYTVNGLPINYFESVNWLDYNYI
jgi:hypothetical protein